MDQLIFYLDGYDSGDNQFDGGYEVLQYSFSTEREIDKKGQPTSAMQAIVIEVEVYSFRAKGNMIGILFNQSKPVTGKIDFFTNDPKGGRTRYKTMKIEKVYIFRYAESLAGHKLTNRGADSRGMTEKLSLTAGKVDVEGSKYSHDWTR
jgi:hypothetical protein